MSVCFRKLLDLPQGGWDSEGLDFAFHQPHKLAIVYWPKARARAMNRSAWIVLFFPHRLSHPRKQPFDRSLPCVSYAPIHSTIWTRVNNLAKRKLAALHDFSRFLVTFRRSAHYHSPFAGTQVSTAQAALCVCAARATIAKKQTNNHNKIVSFR